MPDIIERLRTTQTQRTWDSVGRAYDYPESLPREAADEIERLRAALVDAALVIDRLGRKDFVVHGQPIGEVITAAQTKGDRSGDHG